MKAGLAPVKLINTSEKNMKLSARVLLCIFIALLATAAPAQKNKKANDKEPVTTPAVPKIKLTDENLYFTEPYIFLSPPVKNRIAMCLELDYAYVRYPFGFVNTLDLKGPLVEFRKRIRVTEEEQIKKNQ